MMKQDNINRERMTGNESMPQYQVRRGREGKGEKGGTRRSRRVVSCVLSMCSGTRTITLMKTSPSHIVNTSPPPSFSSSVSSSIRLKTFSRGLEFIQRNKDADEWCLLLETFDPHEPFFSQPEFHAM